MTAFPDIPTADLARVVAAVRAIDVGRAELLTTPTPNARVVHATRLGSTRVARAALVLLFVLSAIFMHSTRGRAWISSPTPVPSAEEFRMNRFQVMAVTGAAAGMTALSSAGVASAQDAVQWRVEDGGNGHWYELVISSSRQTWQVSRDSANASGGHLATVTTAAEDVFIRSWLPPYTDESGGQAWLGAYQDRSVPDYSEPFGGWRWVTGEAMGYQAWSHGGSEANYPGADFLALAHREFEPGYFWNDMQTDYFGGRFFSIVEYSADCNSDGIVDYGQIRAGELVDVNANNIPDCCEQSVSCSPCPGDIDESGTVNGVDLAAILAVWGSDGGKYPRADTNNDGVVNGADLATVLGSWGSCE